MIYTDFGKMDFSDFTEERIKRKMSEKRTFILAVPTVIIIIIVMVGISLIFYNRNIKKMNRDDVKALAQKVATIDNISCEIAIESSEENVGSSISDYKLKDGKMTGKVDTFEIYDNKAEQELIQIDEDSKEAYVYSEYSSQIDNFEAMLCTAEKLLESNDYEYLFKKYETVNGVKCVAFALSNSNTTFDIWLDKSNGMIVKMVCSYSAEGENSISTTMYYRYKIGGVTDADVQKPNLDGYTTIQL